MTISQIKNRPIRKTRKPKTRKEGRQDGYLTPDWRDDDPFGLDASPDPDSEPTTMAQFALRLFSGMGDQRRKRGKRRYTPVMFFSAKVARLREMGGHAGLAKVNTPSNTNRKGMRKS